MDAIDLIHLWMMYSMYSTSLMTPVNLTDLTHARHYITSYHSNYSGSWRTFGLFTLPALQFKWQIYAWLLAPPRRGSKISAKLPPRLRQWKSVGSMKVMLQICLTFALLLLPILSCALLHWTQHSTLRRYIKEVAFRLTKSWSNCAFYRHVVKPIKIKHNLCSIDIASKVNQSKTNGSFRNLWKTLFISAGRSLRQPLLLRAFQHDFLPANEGQSDESEDRDSSSFRVWRTVAKAGLCQCLSQWHGSLPGHRKMVWQKDLHESGPSRLFYGGLAKYTNWRCSCRCFLLEPESIFCDCLLFHVCSSASIGFAPASEAVALMSLDQTPIVSLPPDLGSRKYTGYESELSNPFTASTGSIYDGHLATPQDV